jgi:hypothetical protein
MLCVINAAALIKIAFVLDSVGRPKRPDPVSVLRDLLERAVPGAARGSYLSAALSRTASSAWVVSSPASMPYCRSGTAPME